jgi:uncharacterized protein
MRRGGGGGGSSSGTWLLLIVVGVIVLGVVAATCLFKSDDQASDATVDPLAAEQGAFSAFSSPARTAPASVGVGSSEIDDPLKRLVGRVTDDVQWTWDDIFASAGRRYVDTTVALYDDRLNTPCGEADADVGPFYCPQDQRVYLDLSFFQELRARFGARGDFAEAYVVAHEIGHHVQHLVGIDRRVFDEAQRYPQYANELSVRLELQADCFAGVWAHAAEAEGALSPGDLEEGMQAAAAVGDDRIQRHTSGRVDPETWTHGSSEMRRDWFHTGYVSGTPASCDTFAAGAV